MSFYDYTSDYSDTEFELLSDSGYSVESSQGPDYSAQSVTLSHQIYILFPIFEVELEPMHYATPLNLTVATKAASTPHKVLTSSAKHRLIKWTLPPPPVTAAPLPGWKPMPYGLETFWQSAFAWFFRPFLAAHGHLWTLEPTELPPLSIEWPWHATSYLAKVRFQCQCKHGWTSMKGRVAFWFRIRRQGDQILCESLFKLFGQQCKSCNHSVHPFSSSEFEFLTPLWYPDQVENAISFLASQVINSYYGGRSIENGLSRDCIRRSQRKQRTSTAHHDSSRCQACKDGWCTAASGFLFV